IPPPAVISAPSVSHPIVQPAVSPIGDDLPPAVISQPPPPSQQPLPPPAQVTRENSWSSNGNSPAGSVTNSDISPRPSHTPTLPGGSMTSARATGGPGPAISEHNGNYNQKYSNPRTANHSANYHSKQP